MGHKKGVITTHSIIDGLEHKKCSNCNFNRTLSCFSLSSKEADGLHSWCKKCNNEYQYKRYHDTPIEVRQERTRRKKDQLKVNRLMTRYGLTPDMIAELSKQQNYQCLICDCPIEVVDHDHKTGKFRGLLCRRCNNGLGFFRDNIEFLQNAIKYLNKNNEQTA